MIETILGTLAIICTSILAILMIIIGYNSIKHPELFDDKHESK